MLVTPGDTCESFWQLWRSILSLMKQKCLYQLGSFISTTLRQRLGVLLVMRDECMSLNIRTGSDASQPCHVVKNQGG